LEYSDCVSQKERHYINARVARMTGDPDQAIQELNKILEHDPDDKTALEGFASIHETLRQYESAIDCFNRVIEVDPLYKEAYNGLAYAYDLVGDFDKSIWAADKYVSLAPDEHNPYDTRGDIYAWNGRLDQALESYRKTLEIRPDFDPTLAKLGHIYLFKREYARAESLYRGLCASTDKDYRSEGRIRLAFVAAYQGKFEEALETLDAGIRADQMERSEYWLPDKYQAKSEIYLERDEITRAIEEFEKSREAARRLWPDELVYWDVTYVMFLAENHEIARAEDLAEAIRKYFETENEPWKCYYWLAAGWLERAKGDLEAALTNFEKAAIDLPRFRERYILARTYQESGRLGDAATEFETMLLDYGETRANEPIWAAKAYYLLGLAYEQSGWNKKAIEQYEEFLEIWSDADPGVREVEDARQRLSRLRRAP
jgi:tetratricopeptide (TPR) repeat protein